jgi:hypothetical protein
VAARGGMFIGRLSPAPLHDVATRLASSAARRRITLR